MKKILQKISWKTHLWNSKISLFNIYFGSDNHKFGFKLLNIDNGIQWQGSLFEITWRFPTAIREGELSVDMLFLFQKWDNWCVDMIDHKLWGVKLNWWEKLNFYINTRLKSLL